MTFPIQNLTNNLERDLPGTAVDKVDVEQGHCLSVDYSVATDSIPGEDDQDEDLKSNSSVNQSDPSTEGLPPKSITLQRDIAEDTPIFGYAQLHYDEQNETIVPMLLMSSSNIAHGMEEPGNQQGRPARRMITPALFPPLYRAPTSPARSFTTVSTMTAQHDDMFHDLSSDDDQIDADCAFLDQMMLGREAHDYLLKDSKYAHHVRTVGCHDVFRKLPKSLFHRKRKGREDAIPKERDTLRTYTLLAA